MNTFIILGMVLVGVQGQVSPTWGESIYMQTKDVTLVNNNQQLTGTIYQNSTYNKTLSNPQVALAITKIRIVSDGQSAGFCSTISSFYSDRFTHMLEIFSTTEIWQFDLRYLAFDGDTDMLSGVQIVFFNDTPANINTGSGVARSSVETPALTNNVDTSHTFTIGTFIAGMQGTSTDIYDVNVTAVIGSTSQLNVTLEVSSQPQITHLTFYFLIADLTNLAVQSWTFVESSITTSTDGVQNNDFTPSEAFFDDNFVAGLRSFTFRDNIQFNFTLDNVTFTTSETSQYDDVDNWNLWTRECESPYTYYNKVDGLCYTECPDTTYPVEAYLVCEACDYTCATCTDSSSCDTCPTNREISGSALCTCVDYYYQLSQNCQACHYSCQTCTHNQYYNCSSCQNAMHRSYNSSTKQCPCDSGYEDVEERACVEICGDGTLYDHECDDGNTVDDDGCDSLCQVEEYFTCDGGSPTNCYFVANITITLAKAEKQQYSNMAHFYLQITPYIPILTKLTTESLLTNISGFSSTGISSQDEYIILSGTYTQDIQSTYARFDMKPTSSGVFSQFDAVNSTIKVASSNGLPLVTYTDDQYTSAGELAQGSFVVGWIGFGVMFLFCWLEGKQLGNQLFFTVQYSFMSYVVLSEFTPYEVGGCQVRYVMGYNGLVGQLDSPELVRRVMYHMGYSPYFQYNFNVMFIIQGIALIMYFVYFAAKKYHERKQAESVGEQDFEETIKGKILSLFSFEFLAYWTFINMNQVFMATTLQGENPSDNGAIWAFVVISLILVVIAIFGVFVRHNSMKSYRKILFHSGSDKKITFLLNLIGIIFMDAFLLMAAVITVEIYFCSLIVSIAIAIYVVVKKPFRMMLNNIRLFLLYLCLLTVQILIILSLYLTESETFYFPIGILVCISFSILFTLIVWVVMIVMRFWYHFHPQVQNPVDKTQFSSEKDEKYFNKKMRQIKYGYHQSNLKYIGTPLHQTNQTMIQFPKTSNRFDKNPHHLAPRNAVSKLEAQASDYQEELNPQHLKTKRQARSAMRQVGQREKSADESIIDEDVKKNIGRKRRGAYDDIIKASFDR